MLGCSPMRELDNAIGLTVMASDVLADARTGKNGQHALAGLFRRSVFGRRAGYKDVNDAEQKPRLRFKSYDELNASLGCWINASPTPRRTRN